MIDVLIADDSAVQTEQLSNVLSKEKDFKVLKISKDGMEALSDYISLKPTAFILDLNMPKMSGLDIINELSNETNFDSKKNIIVILYKEINLDIPVIKVKNPNEELYKISQKFYDFDYDKYKIIGVTGTNGKTTVASIIQDLIGDNCGYIGTNGLRSKNINESIRNTTPDSDKLYQPLLLN